MKLLLQTATITLLGVAAMSATAGTQFDGGKLSASSIGHTSKSEGGTKGEGFIYGGFGPHNDSR